MKIIYLLLAFILLSCQQCYCDEHDEIISMRETAKNIKEKLDQARIKINTPKSVIWEATQGASAGSQFRLCVFPQSNPEANQLLSEALSYSEQLLQKIADFIANYPSSTQAPSLTNLQSQLTPKIRAKAW